MAILQNPAFFVDFVDLGAVEVVLRQVESDLLGTSRQFNPEPLFELQVKQSRVDSLREALRDATAGRASISVLKSPAAGEGSSQ